MGIVDERTMDKGKGILALVMDRRQYTMLTASVLVQIYRLSINSQHTNEADDWIVCTRLWCHCCINEAHVLYQGVS